MAQQRRRALLALRRPPKKGTAEDAVALAPTEPVETAAEWLEDMLNTDA